ncbi:hypothetical protein EGI99_05865 [Stutzerimonas stutzeri]|nr:hypothetical protein EGI99_05865 [Stutzerimonas stutzeri]
MRSPRYTTRWDEVSGGGDEDRHCGESLLPTSICDPIPICDSQRIWFAVMHAVNIPRYVNCIIQHR